MSYIGGSMYDVETCPDCVYHWHPKTDEADTCGEDER